MKVLYGVTGEGMGHAMRSRVVLEHLLAAGHSLEIIASGRAAEFLGKRFEGVSTIHGLHMILEENRVRRGKTLWSNVLKGALGVPRNIATYFEQVDKLEPDVVISDFESWTHLYGKTHRLPILSIDNMQVIHRCTLPPGIVDDNRVAFELTKAFIKAKLPGCDAYYITSFFRPPPRKPDTYLFPPFMRVRINGDDSAVVGWIAEWKTAHRRVDSVRVSPGARIDLPMKYLRCPTPIAIYLRSKDQVVRVGHLKANAEVVMNPHAGDELELNLGFDLAPFLRRADLDACTW